MFRFFSSVEKQMRANATNWLELADKILNYRRDELIGPDRAELQQRSEQLRGLLRDKADASKLKLGIEALEPSLRRAGGKFYPRSTIQEYVEFFVVAAIVILGLRAYFVQPFKIPTNSMWPTYYGMTGEVYRTEADEPGAVSRIARLALFGAKRRSVDAPVDGEVWIPVGGSPRGLISSSMVQGRTWGVFPAQVQEFMLRVGDEVVTFTVPADFKFDGVAHEAFFPDAPNLISALQQRPAQRGEVPAGANRTLVPGSWINTGKRVKKGERVLSFDVMTGDQLFVERMSYHFVRPEVGSGFVFRTGNIPDIRRQYGDQYYIKRLVGEPGDQIEIREPALYRNGEPIKGAKAFDRNADREGVYRGYANGGILERGTTFTVEAGHYLALGDNSYDSADSRSWGQVPYKDVVGRPLFIYYPFTKRWGPAR